MYSYSVFQKVLLVNFFTCSLQKLNVYGLLVSVAVYRKLSFIKFERIMIPFYARVEQFDFETTTVKYFYKTKFYIHNGSALKRQENVSASLDFIEDDFGDNWKRFPSSVQYEFFFHVQRAYYTPSQNFVFDFGLQANRWSRIVERFSIIIYQVN